MFLTGLDYSTIYLEMMKKWLNAFRKANGSKLNTGTIYPTPPLGQDMTQGQF